MDIQVSWQIQMQIQVGWNIGHNLTIGGLDWRFPSVGPTHLKGIVTDVQVAETLTIYCNNTLPRGGMYWKIRPLRQFAPQGPRDYPRAKPEGNLVGRGVKIAEGGIFSNSS